ncbi:MAG: right-handed parallel beta-helix repeat-containing protein, partial [Ginsengibacter sp.]
DQWSGTLPSANKASSDGPFKSLQKAKLKVEELNKLGEAKDGIVVMLRKGVYQMKETLNLSKAYSGSTKAPVVWKNYKKERVLLTGGKEIKGFHVVTDPSKLKRINAEYRKNILQINLKSLGITDYGTITNRGRPGLELFFNNKKMMLARWPNSGWDTIADVPQSGELVYNGNTNRMNEGFPMGRHYGRISYRGNRPSHWSHTEDIFLYGYWVYNWDDEFVHVQSIDTLKKEIVIKVPHSSYGYKKGQGYYALNILEELDQPGEWYLDREDGSLFFWPPAPIDSGKVIVSLLNNPVILLDSTSNVHIEGLSIVYSRGNGVVIRGGENNLIAGCTFNNLGDIAVRIDGGIKNGVSSCDFYDLAAGGITLRGGDRKSLTAAGNFAVNNHIHHFGQWLKTHQSAITLSGVGNY